MNTLFQHTSVLLNEAVSSLNVRPDGIYIDGTFGRGGHSRAILESLSDEGRLLVVDKDEMAIEFARKEYGQDPRVVIRHGSFQQIGGYAQELGWNRKVDGVLLDLGVSSPQLDDPERGFSFSQDGPLDMRMDNASGITLQEWLGSVSADDLALVLRNYGEERYSKRIARAVVEKSKEKPIEGTLQLAKIISEAHPRWEKHKHPATRSFQAMRIFLNRELDDLEEGLGHIAEVLAENGRLVAISFHSLEDRIVKRFIQYQIKGDEIPRGLPIIDTWEPKFKKIGKPIKASKEEVDNNPRARSAIMRVAENLVV
ncbi:MAG: 16S rRNA (cytosine(1402)-N(4))-methyltransferase RsmH [Gammaproteobacteria bacterium]|nr:16S rRNA (cytosine(1402)-N(4))-methyltransferase RsmH [Gammaproteobacteria bacterium]